MNAPPKQTNVMLRPPARTPKDRTSARVTMDTLATDSTVQVSYCATNSSSAAIAMLCGYCNAVQDIGNM